MSYLIDLTLLIKKPVPEAETVSAWALIAIAERLERLVELVEQTPGKLVTGHSIELPERT